MQNDDDYNMYNINNRSIKFVSDDEIIKEENQFSLIKFSLIKFLHEELLST